MKKILTMTLTAIGLFAVADETVVQYGETTYGPSDTVVHYDTQNSKSEEKSTIGVNHPADTLYPADEEK